METWSKVFWFFPSFTFNRKIGLQIETSYWMKNLWCFLYITTRVKYHKKKQVNKLLEPKSELDIDKDKEYKIEIIKNSAVYATKVAKG